MMRLTWRDALLAAGVLPLSCLTRPSRVEAALAATARTGGRIYGAAVQAGHLDPGPFRDSVIAQCDSLTPELELKWDATRSIIGTWSTSRSSPGTAA